MEFTHHYPDPGTDEADEPEADAVAADGEGERQDLEDASGEKEKRETAPDVEAVETAKTAKSAKTATEEKAPEPPEEVPENDEAAAAEAIPGKQPKGRGKVTKGHQSTKTTERERSRSGDRHKREPLSEGESQQEGTILI